MELNKRIDINLGYKCNADCKFCYYRPMLKNEFFDSDFIKRKLRAARNLGIKEIDFTGGEPTINKDIFSLIEYARKLGFKKICLITNGIRLADIEFFQRIKEAGVNDVLFSLHGENAETHDGLMGIKGSFEKCLKAIENSKGMGVRVRINSVITELNYRHLPGIARLTAKIEPDVVSLININPCVSKEIYNKTTVPKLKDTSAYAKEAVDILKGKLIVYVMYMPFCLMEGYEEHLCNMHQIQYEPDEWDYLLHAIVENGFFNIARFVAIRGIPHLPVQYLRIFSAWELLHEAMIIAMCRKNNIMPAGCRRCRFYFICDGPWRYYVFLYGEEEFKPVTGEKLLKPYFFMQKQYKC